LIKRTSILAPILIQKHTLLSSLVLEVFLLAHLDTDILRLKTIILTWCLVIVLRGKFLK